MSGVFTGQPYAPSIPNEHERNRDENNSQTTEQRRSPANAQVVEHGTSEEGEASPKHGSHEIVAGKD